MKLFSPKFELVVFCAMRKDWTKGIYHLGALTEHRNLKVFVWTLASGQTTKCISKREKCRLSIVCIVCIDNEVGRTGGTNTIQNIKEKGNNKGRSGFN
jgi:hypothetical protein